MKDYRYLLDLLIEGDLDKLEEASLIIDDFPTGKDDFIQRHWITNAIDCGCLDSIKWVLTKGVDLSFRDPEGYTPILSALDRTTADRYEIIELLIQHGAPIDKKGINDWTPLHMAAAREDIKALDVLIKNGANPAIKTCIDEYATPLEEARILGRKKSVEFLEKYEFPQ